MPPPDARNDALDYRGGLLGAYRLHGNGQGTSVAWEALENLEMNLERSRAEELQRGKSSVAGVAARTAAG